MSAETVGVVNIFIVIIQIFNNSQWPSKEHSLQGEFQVKGTLC